ncbi:MAG: ABC-type Mn2+/Zn2+ transport system permease subunit [Bacteroidia bacterium]|jgi:ABC-type Mn2+/Zn2+ transport system permease subunit
MTEQELSALTDEALLQEAKKMKSDAMMHAVLIGIMIGVVIYGVAKNNLGFLTLIPLFLAYKVFHKPDRNKALKKVLKERNLE